MKLRFLSVICLLFCFLEVFAQTKAIKEANSQLKANKLAAAEKAINAAMTDSTTNVLPNTWNIAGQIQKKYYETENQKAYLHKAYDTLRLYNSVLKMTQYFLKCDSLSEIPDAKGKVKNKFRKANAQSMLAVRNNLANGGYYYMNKPKDSDKKKAIDFLTTYIESTYHPMFGNIPEVQNDTLVSAIAYYISVTALKIQDYNTVSKYSPFALDNNIFGQSAKELLATACIQQNDTLNYLQVLREGIEEYPSDRFFFASLVDYYLKDNKLDDAMQVTKEVLDKYPENAYALYVKGYLYQSMQEYNKAIETYQQVVSIDNTSAEAYSGLGLVYCILAQNFADTISLDVNDSSYSDNQKILKDYYEKAKNAYEQARILKPEQKELWLNGLYRVYYNLRLGEKFDEIEHLIQHS